jgi:hypothetical protein
MAPDTPMVRFVADRCDGMTYPRRKVAMAHPAQGRQGQPSQKNGRDWPGWIQAVAAVLGLLGVSGATIAGLLHNRGDDPVVLPPVVTTAPATTPTRTPATEATTTPTRKTVPPTEGGQPATDPPRPVETAEKALVGDWSGGGPLSPGEQVSFPLQLSLRADGSYEWTRDVVHDSGIWAVEGSTLVFQQESGSQYGWPWRFTTFGSRKVLQVQTDQGGVATLRRQ